MGYPTIPCMLQLWLFARTMGRSELVQDIFERAGL